MVNDPTGDFIIRLKNATAVRKDTVEVPYSKMKEAIALTLKKAGFVGEVTKEGVGAKRTLIVELKYRDGVSVIRGVKRISKPGRRLYAGVADVHPVKYGKGALILSTPRGILTDAEARKLRAGGETLFKIW
jgi:small subunit ribosomal protein S8